MKWIKASERKPTDNEWYICRFNNAYEPDKIQIVKYLKPSMMDEQGLMNNLEWLDESPQHPEQGELKGSLSVDTMKSLHTVIALDGGIKEEDKLTYLFATIHEIHKDLLLKASKPVGEQPPAVEGELYRFIKAGERLPGKEGRYFIRVQMAAYEKSAYFNGEYFEDQFTNKDIEWLEKLASQPPPPLPVEQDELWNDAADMIIACYNNLGSRQELNEKLKSKYLLIKK